VAVAPEGAAGTERETRTRDDAPARAGLDGIDLFCAILFCVL
jgi:hypothetical protein